MPRYYFHLQNGGSRELDCEGVTLPDAEAAWFQAIRSARVLIEETAANGVSQIQQRLEIEDEDGQPVMIIPLHEVAGLAA